MGKSAAASEATRSDSPSTAYRKEHHDPARQVNALLQALGQDKMAIGLFLGAGCPLSIRVDKKPLIPDIAGLTDAVRSKLTAAGKHKKPFEAVESHVKTADCQPTIEDILSHIRSLQRVVGNDAVRSLTKVDLDDLEEVICAEIIVVMMRELPPNDTPYHKLAAWIKSTPRSKPVTVFTTNYDLLMEQALEDQGVPYFDGFVGSRRPFFDPYAMEEDNLPSRWARVWKLHGSINWFEENHVVFRGDARASEKRRLIHPSHLKYDESRRMPYLAMVDRLRSFLKQSPAVLVICGYSFGDMHLNVEIEQGLNGNPTASVFGLLYDDLDKYPLARKIATRCPNFRLLAKDAAIIGAKAAPWIEKEGSSIDGTSIALDWEPKAGDSSGLQVTRMRLGDFDRLGSFCASLLGADSENTESAHAK